MNTTIRNNEAQIGLLASRYGAKNIRIIASKDHDVDVVVQMEPGRTFLDLIGLWHSLENLLGVSVEIVDQPRA